MKPLNNLGKKIKNKLRFEINSKGINEIVNLLPEENAGLGNIYASVRNEISETIENESRENKRNKIKEALSEKIKDQYFFIAELAVKIEDFWKENPKLKTKDIIEKFILEDGENILKLQDGIGILSKKQLKIILESILKQRKNIKSLDDFFMKMFFDGKRTTLISYLGFFIGNKLSLKKKNFSLKKGFGVLEIYASEKNFNTIHGSNISEKLLGFATSFGNLPVIVINTKNKDKKNTRTHELQHRRNFLMMIERLFGKKYEEEWRNHLVRAKDEILAQFRGGNKSIEDVKLFMLNKDGGYNYFEEARKPKGFNLEEFLAERPPLNYDEDWDIYVKEVEKLIDLAAEIMEDYRNKNHEDDFIFNLLAITPIEQWGILI